MGDITLNTIAYAKIMLHAVKYPHCAVNGVLLANAPKSKDTTRNNDLDIIDAIPLFHHSHYVSPMAEIALTQIEAVTQPANLIIAGYYAACENFNDNTIEKCSGQRIAEKIAEFYPSALFIVVNSKELDPHCKRSSINVYQHNDGKWKLKEPTSIIYPDITVFEVVSDLIERGVQKELVDFDNHLDDLTQDWSNKGIQKLVASVISSSNQTKAK